MVLMVLFQPRALPWAVIFKPFGLKWFCDGVISTQGVALGYHIQALRA
jgi:hypothetical protein